MSQRANISQTPETSPSLFKRVAHSEVAVGDVYKGLRRSRRGPKWYANTEGQDCVDTHRQYYRPLTPIPSHQLGPVLVKKSTGRVPEPAPAGQSAGGVAGQTQQSDPHAAGGTCAAAPMEEDDDEDSIPLFTVSVTKAGIEAFLRLLDSITDAKG